MSDSSFEQWIEFEPGFDCVSKRPCHFGEDTCVPDTGGSHGRHGVDMRWYLRGPLGVVQFLVSTGWGIDATPERAWGPAMAAFLGYHAPQPLHSEQMRMDECDVLEQGFCYYDGSGLAADEPWRLLREEGHEAVWAFLRNHYTELFIATPTDDEGQGATVDDLIG